MVAMVIEKGGHWMRESAHYVTARIYGSLSRRMQLQK